MRKRKLILIAGHNRKGWSAYPHLRDPGAIKRGLVSKELDNEHWLMERVATGAYEELIHKYNNIHLLDFSYNLRGKINWINENCTKYDCVVEIHANACFNNEVSGSEVFYVHNGIRSLSYAKKISKIVSENMGVQNRGHKSSLYTRHGRLGIIDDTVTYDFLVELGFLTNNLDYERMKKNGVRSVTAVCEYLLSKIQNHDFTNRKTDKKRSN